MFNRAIPIFTICIAILGCGPRRASDVGAAKGEPALAGLDGPLRASATQPLAIGESFTIASRVMGETRRVNVFLPTIYGQKIDGPLPTLYMLDGGLDEDFLHVAGLLQVLVSNGGMRPFTLVGIPNTQRRRDMTGPTSNPEDRKIAPVVGGSATFRRFIGDELIPVIRARYRTNDEAAIVGESLAGLFVIETFLLEPDLFQTYIAIDPSLWWNSDGLLKSTVQHLGAARNGRKTIFLSNSDEPTMARVTAEFSRLLAAHGGPRLDVRYVPLPAESHATIYHPAALLAFRTVLGPPPTSQRVN